MKINSLLIIMFLFGTSLLQAQNNQVIRLFEKYENEDNVTIIKISKAMFNLIPGNIITDKINIKNIYSKIESLLILTSDKQEMATKMSNDFKSFIDRNKNYEELMRIKDNKKDNKSDIIFYAIKKGDFINEFFMLVNNEKEFVAIRIAGNFLEGDIQQLVDDMQ